MRDAIEYLVIVVLAIVLGVAVLRGVILEPAARLLDRTAATIRTAGQ